MFLAQDATRLIPAYWVCPRAETATGSPVPGIRAAVDAERQETVLLRAEMEAAKEDAADLQRQLLAIQEELVATQQQRQEELEDALLAEQDLARDLGAP
eukprot:COSAG01_NODE_15805_length_1297_cov_14.257930_1_plen_99_part_00